MWRLFLASILFVAAGCAGDKGSDGDAPASTTAAPTPHFAGTDGVRIEVPAGWHETYTEAGPFTDPVLRLAVSSGRIGQGSSVCQVSSYEFPEDEVAIVVVEWTTPALLRAARATPRPRRFTATSLPVRAPPALECFDGPGGTSQFVEAGRLFGAYILLGPKAPTELAAKARAVLDTLLIEMRPARPVKFVPLAAKRVTHCQRSALLRPICPTRVPAVRATYLSHLSRDLLGPTRSLDVFGLERGGEDPNHPERNRPPRMAHIGLLAGETEQIAPWHEPWDQPALALRDGLLKTKRSQPLSFGLATWGNTRGLLFLAPPFPTGGYLGNHLVFIWKSGASGKAVSLHAWEPLTEAAASLRAMTLSARHTAAGTSPALPTTAAQPSSLLVMLPSLGTVSWRCTAEEDRYQLGFRVLNNGATTDVRLVVAGRTLARARVDAGDVPRLPVAGLSQRLVFSQFTGAGTLHASVDVQFFHRPVVSHCNPYSPPQLRIQVTPRR
jgi:hypothetical protein